jgi:uncharacterized protein YlzI (FlbEa/FlbD family)
MKLIELNTHEDGEHIYINIDHISSLKPIIMEGLNNEMFEISYIKLLNGEKILVTEDIETIERIYNSHLTVIKNRI